MAVPTLLGRTTGRRLSWRGTSTARPLAVTTRVGKRRRVAHHQLPPITPISPLSATNPRPPRPSTPCPSFTKMSFLRSPLPLAATTITSVMGVATRRTANDAPNGASIRKKKSAQTVHTDVVVIGWVLCSVLPPPPPLLPLPLSPQVPPILPSPSPPPPPPPPPFPDLILGPG